MTSVTGIALSDQGSPAEELLITVEEIAMFMFGKTDQFTLRRTRHLIELKVIPSFKLGGLVAARRSSIKRAIDELESGATR